MVLRSWVSTGPGNDLSDGTKKFHGRMLNYHQCVPLALSMDNFTGNVKKLVNEMCLKSAPHPLGVNELNIYHLVIPWHC